MSWPKRAIVLLGLLGVFASGLAVGLVSSPLKTPTASVGNEPIRFGSYRPTDQPIPRRLTLVTYNIQLGFPANKSPWDPKQIGGTGEELDRLARAIGSLSPDVVALQEVADDRTNTEIKDQIGYLADRLGMDFVYAGRGRSGPKGEVPQLGGWGNAVLSRYPISTAENHLLAPWTSCLEVSVSISEGESLTVFSTHLNHHLGEDSMRAQVKGLVDLTRAAGDPTAVLGDFNLLATGPELKPLREVALDSCRQVSTPSAREAEELLARKFGGRIDAIFVSPTLRVQDAGVLASEFREASDHVAYYVIVDLPAKGGR